MVDYLVRLKRSYEGARKYEGILFKGEAISWKQTKVSWEILPFFLFYILTCECMCNNSTLHIKLQERIRNNACLTANTRESAGKTSWGALDTGSND